MSDINRYALENLPISEETRKGLTKENICQLGAVGRMLSMQDDAYEETNEEILSALTEIKGAIALMQMEVASLRRDVTGLKEDVSDLREEVKCLGKTVDHTKDEIAEIRLEVDRLKRSNNVWAYAMRIAVGVASALGIVRWIHGPF